MCGEGGGREEDASQGIPGHVVPLGGQLSAKRSLCSASLPVPPTLWLASEDFKMTLLRAVCCLEASDIGAKPFPGSTRVLFKTRQHG